MTEPHSRAYLFRTHWFSLRRILNLNRHALVAALCSFQQITDPGEVARHLGALPQGRDLHYEKLDPTSDDEGGLAGEGSGEGEGEGDPEGGGEGSDMAWAKPCLLEFLESQGHDPDVPCVWSQARKLVLGYCHAERLEVRGLFHLAELLEAFWQRFCRHRLVLLVVVVLRVVLGLQVLMAVGLVLGLLMILMLQHRHHEKHENNK